MKRTDYINQLTVAQNSEAAALAAYRASIPITNAAQAQPIDTPPAPVDVAGSFDGSNALNVTWSPVEDAVSYRAYRRQTGSTGSSDEVVTPDGTTARFEGPFSEGQDVWIEATNEGGNAYSAIVPVEMPA